MQSNERSLPQCDFDFLPLLLYRYEKIILLKEMLSGLCYYSINVNDYFIVPVILFRQSISNLLASTIGQGSVELA